MGGCRYHKKPTKRKKNAARDSVEIKKKIYEIWLDELCIPEKAPGNPVRVRVNIPSTKSREGKTRHTMRRFFGSSKPAVPAPTLGEAVERVCSGIFACYLV